MSKTHSGWLYHCHRGLWEPLDAMVGVPRDPQNWGGDFRTAVRCDTWYYSTYCTVETEWTSENPLQSGRNKQISTPPQLHITKVSASPVWFRFHIVPNMSFRNHIIVFRFHQNNFRNYITHSQSLFFPRPHRVVSNSHSMVSNSHS